MEIYSLPFSSQNNLLLNREVLIPYLPVEEKEELIGDKLPRLGSVLSKILIHWIAFQKIKGYIPVPFSFHKQGKPFFKEYPDFHFNISHSIDHLAVAVSNEVLGIDIEKIRSYNHALAQRFLSKEEYLFIESLPPENQPLAFTSIWNMKESYVKYTGEGIAHTFKSFSILTNGYTQPVITQEREMDIFFKLYTDLPSYRICVCSSHSDSFPEKISHLTIDEFMQSLS